MLEGDVSKEVEKTLQCVVVLCCSIFTSSPDDIVSLDLQKKVKNFLIPLTKLLDSTHRLWPAELSEDDVVVPLHNGLPVDVELPQQAQGIGHLA